MGRSFTFEPDSAQMEMGYNGLLPRYTGPSRYPDGEDGLVSSPAMDGSGDDDAAAEGGGSGGFEWDADSQLYYHARSASLTPNRFVSRDDGRRPLVCGISREVRF
jgi:hypothetical protein